MKKYLIIALCFYAFMQFVFFIDNKMNEEFFDSYYTRDYGHEETEHWWEKAVSFFESLFNDKKDKDKFIYR